MIGVTFAANAACQRHLQMAFLLVCGAAARLKARTPSQQAAVVVVTALAIRKDWQGNRYVKASVQENAPAMLASEITPKTTNAAIQFETIILFCYGSMD